MSQNIVVAGLPESIGEDELHDLFDSFGEIEDVEIPFDPISGRPWGHGVITYARDADVERAVRTISGLRLQDSALVAWVAGPDRPAPIVLTEDRQWAPMLTFDSERHPSELPSAGDPSMIQ